METANSRKVSCVANYAYEASEADELSLRAGDVLRDVERLPGGWWRGELRGRRGMFPDNFVSVLSDHAPPAYSRSGGVQGRCRAVFSYQPANPDELPLCVGDELEVLGEVEEGWWQGRRQGRLGVFPSNFVVMLTGDSPAGPPPAYEPAPALPPKPVKEQCRVLFPYSAVNEDELTLCEGDIVTLVSKEAPDRGWWRGELQGRVGLFPDNFVQLLPSAAHPAAAPEVEDKKPERPTSKGISLPKTMLNKYSEKSTSIKELSTSKLTSLHKESSGSDSAMHKESTVTHTNKTDSEKIVHSETVADGSLDGQVKKPPVPMKKSPTPTSGVGGLLSGLKSKMLSTSDKEKSTPSLSSSTSASNSSGEWDRDRPDGGGASKTQAPATPAPTAAPVNNTSTFDHIERNSILNDPRAGRVKAPRRRPPSQALRDDLIQPVGLSNGQHETNDRHSVDRDRQSVTEKPVPDKDKDKDKEKADELRPKTREWEKHRAPWMDELKLNQAKKTNLVADVGKSRSVSEHGAPAAAVGAGRAGGSTDRILDCGVEERKASHSVEMSRSTSSIGGRMSVLESFEESKVRHSLDSKAETAQSPKEPEVVVVRAAAIHSPTAAGRTFTTMLDEVKKSPAPAPPVSSVRTSIDPDKLVNSVHKVEKITNNSVMMEKNSETISSIVKPALNSVERQISEKYTNDKSVNSLTDDRPQSVLASSEKAVNSTIERRLNPGRISEKSDGVDVLINQLNDRISNLEKLLEVQNAKFNAAMDELSSKLRQESEKRQALQTEIEKLSHCVTQV